MDLLYVAYYIALFTSPIVLYLLSLKPRKSKYYSQPAWYRFVKIRGAKPYVQKFQESFHDELRNVSEKEQERPKDNLRDYETDSQVIYGADNKGNYFSLRMSIKPTLHAEISIEYRNKEGKIYRLPNEPEVLICSIPCRQWKASGLNIEILQPFQRLRITYNGFMRNNNRNPSNNDAEDVEHVKFNFFWNSGTRPLRYPQDANVELLSRAVATESWSRGEWVNMLGADYGYDQFGALQGTFFTSSSQDNLYMPSWRRRRIGPADATELTRDFHIFGVLKDGTLFAIGAKSMRVGCTQLPYGCLISSNGNFDSISSNDISLEHLADNGEIPNVMSIHFQVNNRTYKCVAHINTRKMSFSRNNRQRGWILKTVTAECDVNSEQANAILNFWYKSSGDTFELPTSLLKRRLAENPERLFVVHLNSIECLDHSLTGGKGNSLGMLSYSLKTNKFDVPPGFVITATSFKKHIIGNPALQEAINHLEDICYRRIDGDIEETCKATVDLFTKTPVTRDVSNIILQEIHSLKSALPEQDWRWAIRSSGLDEDSDELSAAGQNSTILGSKSDEDVLKAVSACWGSLFGFQSVEYRRRHGIPVNSQMAVVVQKIIPAKSAGVLFTNHPSTGDPSKMVITSNYGLGESVVSASADPDTIILSRNYKDEVNVLENQIGAKRIKIVLNETSSDGTEEIATEEDLAKELSIAEDQAIRLGKIGIFLEKKFGNPRDIEWAIYDDKIYLLQSRPITTLNQWSNWELEHETDNPVFSEQSLYTRANVGEVCKGAMTVLTQTVIMKTLDDAMSEEGYYRKPNPYTLGTLLFSSHTVFLDLLNNMYSKMNDENRIDVKMIDLAVFGHLVFDERIRRITTKRHGNTSISDKLMFLQLIKELFSVKSVLDKTLRYNNTWEIRFRPNDSSTKMLQKIEDHFINLNVLLKYHTFMSKVGVVYQMIAMLILTENTTKFTDEHYKDLGLLLSTNSSVESAEIPILLNTIANRIRQSHFIKEFLNVDPNDGMDWLEKHCPKIKASIDDFLANHGHRLFREFELAEKSWSMDPSKLISMIQANCISKTVTEKAKGLTVKETINQLTTPKKIFTKFLLRYFIKKCRESVANRERSKSEVIRGVHKLRTAYIAVANKMVSTGLIPEEDLVFHLTHEELKTVSKGISPGLILKALRRKRLYKDWDKLLFPEISNGVPKYEEHIDIDQLRTSQNGVQLRGTPVCQGVVVGRACVITDIKYAKEIQPGDILITYSTDIAWSPYFPMLAGVVTEIGGLISHGAVVAREYGLPCIISAQNATRCFKTGDKIRLSGHLGLLELLE